MTSNVPARRVSLLSSVDSPMRLAALALVVALAPAVAAQGQNNYGSIYSRYALGERSEFGSSQSSMLGHAGTALRSASYVGYSNPALWADQTVTTFSAGAVVASVRAEDAATDGASVGTAGDLSGLHLGIPLYAGRLGAVAVYRPYSRVNYRAATVDSLMVDGTPRPYELNQEGAGGLQQISAGLGWRVGSAVQVGASADVVFGTQERLQRTEFRDPTFRQTRQARLTRVSGVTATVGGTGTLRALAAEDDALTLGASLTLPTHLGGSSAVTIGESLDRDTLAVAADGDMTLPLSARAGLSYRAGQRWLATVEALYEPWSEFESTLAVGGFDPSGADDLRDRWRVGGGFEVTPSGRERRAGLLQRSAYRLGGYAERGLYAPAPTPGQPGADVTTLAVTGGLSVPSRITGARFDLGFELGTRGSTEGVLVRDTFLKGTVTLNFGERWFVRRRFN